MKKFKLLTAMAVAALTVVFASFALVGCGEKDYSFEAENADITVGTSMQFDASKVPPDHDWSSPNGWMIMFDPQYQSELPVKVIVESGNTEHTGSDEEQGPEVTNVGNFYGKGTLMTWKITASKACEATLKLRAASAKVDNGQTPTRVDAVDFSAEAPVKLKVNDTEVALTGVLPGLETIEVTDFSFYRNFADTVTANINLVEGENTIVLVAPERLSVINVDKIIINCSAKLSYTPVDNSDFPSSVM